MTERNFAKTARRLHAVCERTTYLKIITQLKPQKMITLLNDKLDDNYAKCLMREACNMNPITCHPVSGTPRLNVSSVNRQACIGNTK
jgi:hypothetical protein